MALTKITTNVIEDNAITADKIDTSSLTAAGFATESYVTTAVANLVDSAPLTLDTLNELAAALGDDPNFATTVTNSIGTKAPLASPTFTGTITIPTADINAGTIDGTVIGGSSAAAGTFTSITGTSANINGTVTADGLIVSSSAASSAIAGLYNTDTLDGNGVYINGGGLNSGKYSLLVQNAANVSVLQALASGDFSLYNTAGTPKFFWDASAESLGIGTTSPASTLDIFTPTNYGLRISDGTYTGVLVPSGFGGLAYGTTSNHPSIFITNNIERARIDSSGRIQAASGSAFVGHTTTTATSKTLANGEQCFVDTATQTITLPASPSIGDNVTIFVGNFTDTTIARNGANIMGLAENLTIDVANMTISLVYINASTGWRIS